MKRFYVGGRGHGKVAAMEKMKQAAQRGPDYPWAYYDELAPKDSDPVNALVAKAMAYGGEVVVGIDCDVAVVATKRADGSLYVLNELPDVSQYDTIQRMVIDAYEKMHRQHEAFLRQVFNITDEEAEAVKRIDPIIVERLAARMNAEGNLPTNFWESVEAHNMLEDEVGRKLVADIIARKVGCNVQLSSD